MNKESQSLVKSSERITQKGVFLMIDFQEIFQDNATQGWACEGYTDALASAHRAYDRLIEKGWDLCVVKTAYLPPKKIKGPWKEYFEMHSGVPKYPSDNVYKISKNYIYNSETADNDTGNTVTITSSTFGKWDGVKKYYKLIGERIPRNVFVCGVSTDCCVLSTVLAAIDESKRVYVIENACAAGTRKEHRRGMEVLRNFYPNVKVIHSDLS